MKIDFSHYEMKLLRRLLSESALSLTDSLLETCADQEYRICMLELGLVGEQQ